jgi:hypothetical protein
MKNINVLPTNNPSRLYLSFNNILDLDNYESQNTLIHKNQHIYITSDEEIKEGDWVLCGEITLLKVKKEIDYDSIKLANNDFETKKVILTTDEDLIKDSVQDIDDEFLEWFVKNPSCEEVQIEKESKIEIEEISYEGDFQGVEYVNYKIIIPKEEPKQRLEKYSERFDNDKSTIGNPYTWGKRIVEEPKKETLEEVAEKYVNGRCTGGIMERALLSAIDFGAKWQQEQYKKMYSEEDLDMFRKFMIQEQNFSKSCLDVFIEQFKNK